MVLTAAVASVVSRIRMVGYYSSTKIRKLDGASGAWAHARGRAIWYNAPAAKHANPSA